MIHIRPPEASFPFERCFPKALLENDFPQRLLEFPNPRETRCAQKAMDNRLCTTGHGQQAVDNRLWTTGCGRQAVDNRLWTTGRGPTGPHRAHGAPRDPMGPVLRTGEPPVDPQDPKISTFQFSMEVLGVGSGSQTFLDPLRSILHY